jgi:hypothetical protein
VPALVLVGESEVRLGLGFLVRAKKSPLSLSPCVKVRNRRFEPNHFFFFFSIFQFSHE